MRSPKKVLRFVLGSSLLGAPSGCGAAIEECPPVVTVTCNCPVDREAFHEVWPGVSFALGSAALDPNGERTLARILEHASRQADIRRMIVVGHDDGSAADVALARARADAVASHLQAQSVPNDVIERTAAHADDPHRASTVRIVFVFTGG